MSNRTWSIVDILAICAIPLSFLAAWRWDWFHEYASHEPVRVWTLQIGLLLVFSLALGKSKGRGAMGVVIDEADRVSLARLQAFIWTVLLIGGIATAITVNLARGCQEPLTDADPAANTCAHSPFDIDLPDQLLTLAGISAATAGASTIVTAQGLNRAARFSRGTTQIEQMDELGYVERGIIAAKSDAARATLGDLVRGNFITDNPGIELSRIQFLALTLILSGGYAITFAQGLNQNVHQPIATFPGFDSGLNILLGISASAYAGTKAFKAAAVP